jgi:RimJ/RimL family protein N-acetyltransferase
MYIKKIVGKKCYLSPMNAEDAEQYTVWLNDLDVVNYLSLSPAMITLASEKDAIVTLSKGHNYSIIDTETCRLIGSVGLAGVDSVNQTAEIGIFIGDKAFWNNGYGREALCLLINFAYRRLNLHNIYLTACSFNKRALACYEKTGFHKVGEKRESVVRDHIYYNTVIMDILPDDFYNLNPQYKPADVEKWQ